MNTATDPQQNSPPEHQEFRLAICGGGSGGHLTPGIAIAEELEQHVSRLRVAFLTSRRDVDSQVLHRHITFHETWTHDSLPIQGRGRLRSLLEISRSLFAARRVLKRLKPNIVLGTGGFASIPGILAAAMLRIPILILESNVVPGRANRLLNRFAELTLCGFPMRSEYKKRWSSRIEQTGIPLRHCFSYVNTVDGSPEATVSQEPTLLILGGSQGACGLNELVVTALSDLPADSRSFRILHQTGELHAETVRNNWGSTAKVHVVPFIDDLATELQRSDVVISRAGAVAMAEIAVYGRPAIFIPLPNSADGHQRANAEYFEASGAAIVVDQTAPDAAKQLRTATLGLLNGEGDTQKQFSRSMNSLAKPDAVRQIVSRLLQYSSD